MSNLRFNSWFVKMHNNLVVFELPKAARALEWTIPWFLLILSTWHACVTGPCHTYVCPNSYPSMRTSEIAPACASAYVGRSRGVFKWFKFNIDLQLG